MFSFISDAHEGGPQDRPFSVAIPDAIYGFRDPEVAFSSGIEEGELLETASLREAGAGMDVFRWMAHEEGSMGTQPPGSVDGHSCVDSDG